MSKNERVEEAPDVKLRLSCAHSYTRACTPTHMHVHMYTHMNISTCLHDTTPSPRFKKKSNLKNVTLISGGAFGHIYSRYLVP